MDQGIVPTDEKGRPLVEHMSDSEKMTEILVHLRAFNDMLEQVAKNPMLGAMGVRLG